jgi:hypothetical protein
MVPLPLLIRRPRRSVDPPSSADLRGLRGRLFSDSAESSSSQCRPCARTSSLRCKPQAKSAEASHEVHEGERSRTNHAQASSSRELRVPQILPRASKAADHPQVQLRTVLRRRRSCGSEAAAIARLLLLIRRPRRAVVRPSSSDLRALRGRFSSDSTRSCSSAESRLRKDVLTALRAAGAVRRSLARSSRRRKRRTNHAQASSSREQRAPAVLPCAPKASDRPQVQQPNRSPPQAALRSGTGNHWSTPTPDSPASPRRGSSFSF